MAEFFASYGLFLLKVLTFLIAILIVIFTIAMLSSRGRKPGSEGSIEITSMNEQYDGMREALSLSLLDDQARKLAEKDKKAEEKAERKAQKAAAKKARKQRGDGETHVSEPDKKRVFVMDFDGDIRDDDVVEFRTGFQRIITKKLSGRLDYAYVDSDSNVSNLFGVRFFDFTRHTFNAQLIYDF